MHSDYCQNTKIFTIVAKERKYGFTCIFQGPDVHTNDIIDVNLLPWLGVMRRLNQITILFLRLPLAEMAQYSMGGRVSQRHWAWVNETDYITKVSTES